MLMQPMIQQLHEMRLHGMAAALEQQLGSPQQRELTFEERFGMLL
jgi:hypothetical protein